MKRSGNFFVFFLLVFNLCLCAQKYETHLVSKLSTEEGLSNNIIYSVLQDSCGFIWIATEQGLNKYDGKNLTYFSANKKDHRISHNRTQTMLLAPDGNIWAGTSYGLNIYDYKTDSIIQVTTFSEPLKLVYNDITVLKLSQDNNVIWLGTYGNGVNYFNRELNQFFSLVLPDIPDVEQPLKVMSLLEDDHLRLWIGTQANGLYLYDLHTKKIQHFQLPDNARFVRNIFQDKYRRVWIGTSKGCYIYNETTNFLELVRYPEELMSNSIGSIIEDKNGLIWVGTESSLLNFSSGSFSRIEEFNYQLIKHGELRVGLNCPSVNTLFSDNENNIWIGTAWGGINMLKGRTAKFRLYKHNPHQKNTLPNSPVTAICNEQGQTLYIATMGTDQVGLCTMDLKTGRTTEHPFDKKFPDFIYQTILIDSDRNLWIGTYGEGLIKAKLNGFGYKQFKNDPLNKNTLPGNDVRIIYESKDKKLWFGTQDGLATYDKNKNKITRVELLKDSKLSIRIIKEDTSGTLWIGTYGNGVILYDPIRDSVNTFLSSQSPNIVHDIFIHGKEVWMATTGDGLAKFDMITGSMQFFKESQGLGSDYTHSVLRDASGNIWVGHNNGLSKFTPGTQEIINFTSVDGLQSYSFTDHTALLLPDGLMVFGGFGGINIFDPANVVKDDKCPPVVFTKLYISNEPVKPFRHNKINSPIKENISLTDQININYKQKVFTIEFMGINYNANPKIQYAYILEGADKEWIDIGSQNNVTFRNLNAGNYTFKVKASSPDGVWSNDNIATLGITVHPPIWATVWAYLVYTALLLVLLYFIGLFIVIRIRAANNLKIERARREKDEELHQAKIQFFTNISHELRTPLTLILGPLETLHSEEKDEDKKSVVNLILHNAKRLLAMVNQLLDFRKAERGQMKLKIQYANIIQTISHVVLSFNELKKQKEIQMEFPQRDEIIMAWYDQEFISKSLVNLLSNSFKFTPSGGTITVLINNLADATGNQTLSLTVSDTGKGIQEKDLPHIFERFYQGDANSRQRNGTGIGLHFVKSLIELHHGAIEVESIPNLETTFKITIPNVKSAYLKDEFYNSEDISDKPQLDVSGYIHISEEEAIQHIEKKKKDKRKKILIVEDNSDIRNYIKNILGDDYTFEEAENGKVGWDLINLYEFDLVISDIMMPVMGGIEMCNLMKTSIETDHIPIILLTAKTDIENRIEGLSVGADSYITKPFHPKHLKVSVAKLIELRDLLKERYSRKIVFGEFNSIQQEADSPEETFLQKAISVVLEKMIDSEFSGNNLAKELNISRMGLHRKIKALTGQTTGEFIRNLRLKKAHDLLTVEGKNVSEVCYEVGFSSPSYFSTCFNVLYKMSPSEYVRTLKREE